MKQGSKYSILAWCTGLVVVMSACSSSSPPLPVGTSFTVTATEAVVEAAASIATPMAGTAQPAVANSPVQQLGPDSFGKAQVLHEFWPEVQKTARLYPTIQFGTSVTGWALSPDGRYIAVAGCDSTAGNISNPYNTTLCEKTISESASHAYFYIFNAKSGDLIATLPESGQVLTVTDLRFTHDSRKLVYVIYYQTLKVWDIDSAKVETTVTDKALEGYDISPDDKRLVLTFSKKQGRIWDLGQNKYTADIPTYGRLQFSPDGGRILAEDFPYMIVYDTAGWQKVSQQAMMPDSIPDYYGLSSDLSLMAVCDLGLDDQPVRIWDVATASLLKTLKEKFGKCGRVMFSPDGKYLLFFNDHGAGPLVWSVDGWKYAVGSEASTNFVGATDLFVDRIEFSHDQSMLLVGTFSRLTLYALPAGELPPQTVAGGMTPTPVSVPSGAVEPPPVDCSLKVTGWIKLETTLCGPHSGSSAGDKDGIAGRMLISLWSDEFTHVTLSVPDFMQKNLKPGKYGIGDGSDSDEGRMTATLDYYDASANSLDPYYSYAETGEIVITETGPIVSGSYKFGAHTDDGREINAEGTFTNVPYVHTNRP